MKQSIQGQIPDKKYYHNPELTDKDGHTVCYYLWNNGIYVPEEWQDSQYKNPKQDCYGYTDSMNLTIIGIIPNKENYHNPNIINTDKQTMAQCLKYRNLPVPNQWYDNNMQNIQRNSEFIQQVIFGEIPIKPKNINSNYQNIDGFTVAMCLALNEKEIPKQWKHDSSIQNNYGNTVAMILAENRQIPVKKWYHNPQLQNNNKDTVAMLLAQNGIIPPKEWYHNPNIKNNYGWTVAHCLKLNNLPVPNEWYDDKEMKDKEKNPDFIQQAIYGIIPLKLDNIQSNHCNCEGWTVAMILAILNKQIPLEWQHDKYLRNDNGDTVQSILHKNNIEIPKYWQYPSTFDFSDNSSAMIQAMEGEIPDEKNYHDPRQTNIYGDTVAMIFVQNKIIPPKEWYHDPLLKNKDGQSIQYILKQNNMKIPEEWKIPENQEYYDNIFDQNEIL